MSPCRRRLVAFSSVCLVVFSPSMSRRLVAFSSRIVVVVLSPSRLFVALSSSSCRLLVLSSCRLLVSSSCRLLVSYCRLGVLSSSNTSSDCSAVLMCCHSNARSESCTSTVPPHLRLFYVPPPLHKTTEIPYKTCRTNADCPLARKRESAKC